jgi:hypothetical protein
MLLNYSVLILFKLLLDCYEEEKEKKTLVLNGVSDQVLVKQSV